MRARTFVTLAATCGTFVASACSSPVCPDEVYPGIVVSVIDSVTGEPAAAGATGMVVDGSYSELMSAHRIDGNGKILSLAAATGREGTYSVTIEKPGYETWFLDGIQVSEGLCSVETVELNARLQPT